VDSVCLLALRSSLLLLLFQVEFFTSMGLPYHAISDAEFKELAGQLAQVLNACGEWEQAKAVASSSSRSADTAGLQDM
jgi:hypothetical protein